MYLKNVLKRSFSVDKVISNQTKILLNIIISVYLTGKEIIIYCFLCLLFLLFCRDDKRFSLSLLSLFFSLIIRNNEEKRVLSDWILMDKK